MMYALSELLGGIAVALLICFTGILVLRIAYKRARNPETSQPLLGRVAVWFTQITQGRAAGEKKQAQVFTTEYVRRSGHWGLLAGGAMLLGGALQFVGWMIKIAQLP